MKNLISWVAVGIAIVAVVIAVVGGNNQPQTDTPTNIGGMTNYDGVTIIPVDSGDGLTVGLNGSTVAELKAEIGTLLGTTNASHTASTTKYYYAAVTGVASGDVVFAQFATSSPGFANSYGLGWAITSAKASSTEGFVDLTIANFSGQSIAPSAAGGFGSTTNIFYLDI